MKRGFSGGVIVYIISGSQ